MLTYWTHIKCPDKTPHERSETVYDDPQYWGRYDEDVASDANEAFIDDLLNQTSHHEMARRYGRDYMKNFAKYQQFGVLLRNEHMRNLQKDLVGTASYVDPTCDDNNTYHAELHKDELVLIDLVQNYDVDIQDLISYAKHKAGIYE